MRKCALCGGGIRGESNATFIDDKLVHKKCPQKKAKLTDEEKEQLKELQECIEWLAVKHDRVLNWGLISKQIKELKDMGYNYVDQLYGLKYLVTRDDNVFWGYGRLQKFIAHAMENRKREENRNVQVTQKPAQIKPQKLASKSFMDF